MTFIVQVAKARRSAPPARARAFRPGRKPAAEGEAERACL